MRETPKVPLRIADALVEHLSKEAAAAEVREVRVGVIYTAVQLVDGRTGVALTAPCSEPPDCRSAFAGLRPLGGRSAASLVPLVRSKEPVEAAVGLACVNALCNVPSKTYDFGDVLDHVPLESGDRVGMVGLFRPLLGRLRQRVERVTVFDLHQAPDEEVLPAEMIPDELPGCSVAFVTATSLVNGTLDGVLAAAQSCREVVLLGASTPLLPSAFSGSPVSVLAGVVVREPEAILHLVSEAAGMRSFRPHIDKVVLEAPAIRARRG